jgi:PAS domain S-box-containing protein
MLPGAGRQAAAWPSEGGETGAVLPGARGVRSGEDRGRPAILVVEDDHVVALDLQQMMDSLGYDAYATAASAEEALAEASRRRPDLVLMDVRIEGSRDGIHTAALLRQLFDVPIVYLTAYSDYPTLERAKQTDPYGYLVKPIQEVELRTAIEISLHKHAVDQRTRQRERWIGTVLDAITDAVVSMDDAGRITLMNQAAMAMAGPVAAEALGQPVGRVLALRDDSGRIVADELSARALCADRPVELSGLRLRLADETRLIEGSATRVRDERGPGGVVMVLRDVTERNKLQEQMAVADRLVSLGVMAAGVAHEVNNPLSVVVIGIDTAARVIERQRTTGAAADAPTQQELDEARQGLADGQTAAIRIARIIDDLRTFAQPVRTSHTVCDVDAVVTWAVRATAREWQGNVRLDTDIGAVPPVRGDAGRLGQVLVNLLSNAAQAIPAGRGGEVHISVRGTSDWVKIEVRDDGDGMSPETMRRIFDPFFTSKAVGAGMGLGLSICRSIVTSLGGRLEVESTPGRGSVFRVVLPAARHEHADAPRDEPAAAPRCGRILLVDDDVMILRALGRVLSEHQVVEVDSARQAFELVASGERFDLVLCDLMMPEMTGRELFDELARHYPDVAERVVFITGAATNPALEQFLRTARHPYISKPVDARELRRIVAELLGQFQEQQPARGR